MPALCMPYDQKQLWKDIQLYVRSTGLIIKKIPVTLLKEHANLIGAGGEGTFTAQRLQDVLSGMGMPNNDLCRLAGADPNLRMYCEDVFRNKMWSKHANVYLAFQTESNVHTVKPMNLVGMVASGTFNADREDDGGKYSLTMPGGTDRVAEIELVLAGVNTGVGHALTLWAIGDLFMRKRSGDWRYRKVIAFATLRMARLLQSYGFRHPDVHQLRGGRRRMYPEDAFTLSNNAQNCRRLLTHMQNERPGLFDVCGDRGMRLWQQCR